MFTKFQVLRPSMEPDLFEKKSQIISEYGKARKLFHTENNGDRILRTATDILKHVELKCKKKKSRQDKFYERIQKKYNQFSYDI